MIQTLEHRRFVEFCDACIRYRYIGLCYGRPGVGKTVSARHYSNWDKAQAYWDPIVGDKIPVEEIGAHTTVFYTAPVVCSPRILERDIAKDRSRLRGADVEIRRRAEDVKTQRLLRRANELRDRHKNPDGYRSKEAMSAVRAFYDQRDRMLRVGGSIPDPTTLLIIDEADRLKVTGLEEARNIFDQGGIGLVLIGMPGIEKRLARYPQLYSRVGFVHEFRPLSPNEIRQLLEQCWAPPGVKLPDRALDSEAIAAVIRITGGNFRLLNRLLTQVERILEINSLGIVTKPAIEAARENLVIGQS